MTCTVSPNTSTSREELGQFRSSLKNLMANFSAKGRFRATSSAHMNYTSPVLASPAIQRRTRMTLPLVLPDKALKLDVTGNKLLYTLSDKQTFSVAPHLPLEYVSVTADGSQLILYSVAQTEGTHSARYACVIHMQVPDISVPLPVNPNRPPSIPLCPLDAEFNKSIPTTSISSVSGTAGDVLFSVLLTFYRSHDGGPFSPHSVSAYGWDIPTETSEDNLHVAAQLDVNTMTYPVNERHPFGGFFQTCRPPGFKESWKRVATKEYSTLIMETEIPNGVEVCAQAKGITEHPNYAELKSAIVNGSSVVLRHESGGGLLYLPVNLFEIRPRIGKKIARVNVVDTGPFPRRTPRGKSITQGYRPVDTKFYSAGGNYQYIQGTWESLAKRYASIFGVTTGLVWVWEAPPQAQAWYQAAYCTEFFHKYTRHVRDIFPPYYYAIMVHANNIGTSMSQKYLQAAARAIAEDRVTNPSYNRIDAHLTCKRVYEQKAWLIAKHSAYINRVAVALQRELPRIDPIMYPNNPALYPKAL